MTVIMAGVRAVAVVGCGRELGESNIDKFPIDARWGGLSSLGCSCFAGRGDGERARRGRTEELLELELDPELLDLPEPDLIIRNKDATIPINEKNIWCTV